MAKLPHLSTKVFRQTFATLARLANLADVLTTAQLGHARPSTTDIYTRVPSAERKKAAESMAQVLRLPVSGPDSEPRSRAKRQKATKTGA